MIGPGEPIETLDIEVHLILELIKSMNLLIEGELSIQTAEMHLKIINKAISILKYYRNVQSEKNKTDKASKNS